MSPLSSPRRPGRRRRTLRDIVSTLSARRRLHATDKSIFPDPSRSASAMTELFVPLDRLLGGGGDARLTLDPVSGVNAYGCRPCPCPDTLSFASSTATSISQRGYERVGDARESLMRSAVAVGIEAAFDARVESMRDRLKCYLGLSSTGVDIAFSPSGTDSQLQALLLARGLLGPRLTTVIVAADQTGSGTVDTARGRHFSTMTANGHRVGKGDPIAGLADAVNSTALPSFDAAGGFRSGAENDQLVIGAIERSVAGGSNVLLQIMDASKLGWRAPGDQCLDEIARRWPDRVQVVVDACQTRLGRPRLRGYLDRGYLVIITGSKFFTGPAFSGALLVPSRLAPACDAITGDVSGFCEYSNRSDWPMHWKNLRSRFAGRTNFGQWLRWEAALEEIRAYYAVPDRFRLQALTTFGEGVARIIGASPSLRLLPQNCDDRGADDEELARATIFPFAISHRGRDLALDDCRMIYRELGCASADERPEAPICLVGQPVALGGDARSCAAVLRISASARLVTEAWSPDETTACGNLRRELDHVGAVVAKIERLVARRNDPNRNGVLS
jgi:hypothetical protein